MRVCEVPVGKHFRLDGDMHLRTQEVGLGSACVNLKTSFIRQLEPHTEVEYPIAVVEESGILEMPLGLHCYSYGTDVALRRQEDDDHTLQLVFTGLTTTVAIDANEESLQRFAKWLPEAINVISQG